MKRESDFEPLSLLIWYECVWRQELAETGQPDTSHTRFQWVSWHRDGLQQKYNFRVQMLNNLNRV